MARHSATPLSVLADYVLRTVEMTVALTYALPTVAQEDQRYAVMQAMTDDADTVTQALTFPGNLANDGATTDPVATGIIGAMAVGPGGEGYPIVDRDDDWETQAATTTIALSVIVKAAQPVE
jgi:hypothetical protein